MPRRRPLPPDTRPHWSDPGLSIYATLSGCPISAEKIHDTYDRIMRSWDSSSNRFYSPRYYANDPLYFAASQNLIHKQPRRRPR